MKRVVNIQLTPTPEEADVLRCIAKVADAYKAGAEGQRKFRPNRQLQGQRHRVDLDRRGTPQGQVRDGQTPDLPTARARST
jgi:hypothetical protein